MDRWRPKKVIAEKMEKQDDISMGLAERTGALMMINKKEKKLLRTILEMTMRSSSARDWIVKKLGSEYLAVGTKLLKSMGGTEV
jgi:hypothetical protein